MDAIKVFAVVAGQGIPDTIAFQVHDIEEAQVSDGKCAAIKAYCK